jgi:hypothetical protein
MCILFVGRGIDGISSVCSISRANVEISSNPIRFSQKHQLQDRGQSTFGNSQICCLD